MKGTSLFLCLALAVIMALVPTITYSGVPAPIVDLPETGQTTSYYAGDDGDLQMGVDWSNPRFTDPAGGTIDASDKVIKDNLTGLEWLRNANCIGDQYPSDDSDDIAGDGAVTWTTGRDFIGQMNLGNKSNCDDGGITDWRMPNINELDSLLNFGTDNLIGWLGSQGFLNVQSDNYWVSTAYSWYLASGWAVRITANGIHILYEGYQWDGNRNAVGTISNRLNTTFPYIWPVRSGPNDTADPAYPANIPKTGQSGGNWTWRGTDGYENLGSTPKWYGRWGVSWPASGNSTSGRFNDNTDETMTDLLTGLMWPQGANIAFSKMDSNGKVNTWQDALDFVDDMNTQANGRCIKPLSIQDCSNYPWPPGNPATQPCTDPLLPTCMVVGGVEQCRSAVGNSCASDADCDTANGEVCVFIPNYNYTDWRLPNIWELKSLNNFQYECQVGLNDSDCPPITSPARYLSWEGFDDVFGGRDGFWSSTTDGSNTNNAYTLIFGRQGGVMGSFGKTDTTTAPHWGPNPSGQAVLPVRTEGADDGDGVDPYVENDAPNDGDGNDDGIPDLIDPLVTSLPSATGFVTVVTSGGGCTQNMNVQTAPASPADPGFSYPLGVAGFEIRCATGPADMEIIFHGSSDLSGMVYRNYGSTGPAFGAPAWYEMTGATFGTRVIDGQTVATATFQIVENQLGDHNNLSNIIVSLGGPALPAPPVAVPAMTQWGMIIFMFLAISGAVYYLSRRRTGRPADM